ncbi:hypothetical protein NC652_024469 [Populus alba x Populus x berolinensis]|nr:hypothetical protein NC652_024469 [Populus alba x Populus x berolinensis]
MGPRGATQLFLSPASDASMRSWNEFTILNLRSCRSRREIAIQSNNDIWIELEEKSRQNLQSAIEGSRPPQQILVKEKAIVLYKKQMGRTVQEGNSKFNSASSRVLIKYLHLVCLYQGSASESSGDTKNFTAESAGHGLC